MTLTIEATPVPLKMNEEGVILVRDTRIPLDTIIYAFCQGDSAEQIVDSYDTLQLRDVYAILAYYLAHEQEVNSYLREREAATENIHHFIDTHFDQHSFRERLLARQKKHAQNGG